jgi:hypothetical protein
VEASKTAANVPARRVLIRRPNMLASFKRGRVDRPPQKATLIVVAGFLPLAARQSRTTSTEQSA